MQRFRVVITAILALLMVGAGPAVAAGHALPEADHHRFERSSAVPSEVHCLPIGVDHIHETTYPCVEIGVTGPCVSDDKFTADFAAPQGAIPPAIERPPAF